MSDDYIVNDLSAFGGEKLRVGVGFKFDSFDDGHVTVAEGDVAAFTDPDAGQHASGCEFVHMDEFSGWVSEVYAVDYDWVDGYAVEIGTTMPVGRLGVTDSSVGIVTEGGVYGGMSEQNARHLAGKLVDGEYDRYYNYTAHLGQDGVPEDMWDAYEGDTRSGPGCPVCRGDEGQDGVVVTGE